MRGNFWIPAKSIVRLLLPGKLDAAMAKWFSQAMYQELIESGISIHEFRGDVVLHAKVTVVDDKILLGTSNVNHRSFSLDMEMDVLLSDSVLLQKIDLWQQGLIKQSSAVRTTDQVSLYHLKVIVAGIMDPLKQFF